MKLIDNCIIFSTYKHAEQLDKLGSPYIYHPLRVMLDESLTTETQKCVAICHDLLEDTTTTIEELHKIGMSDDMITVIVALTHLENEPNTTYWQRILDEPSGDAKIVKLADIKDNTSENRMNGLSLEVQERLKTKYAKALEYLNRSQEVNNNAT
jgi:GTP diphosphokinase / guanosine-3',5'-bis(diphosphate) 3'-diphosphatase